MDINKIKQEYINELKKNNPICTDHQIKLFEALFESFKNIGMNESEFLLPFINKINLLNYTHDMPENVFKTLISRAGYLQAIDELKKLYPIDALSNKLHKLEYLWQNLGLYFRDIGKPYETIEIFKELYNYLLEYQQKTKKRIHKGMPLVWIQDQYFGTLPQLAKKYMMLTLIEDAIRAEGVFDEKYIQESGSYFRLISQHGMTHQDINNYFVEIYKIYQNDEQSKFKIFPEYILQNLNKDWMIELPSDKELYICHTNSHYLRTLLQNLESDATGKTMELMADYLLSCLPGFRTKMRENSKSTDYDVLCTINGKYGDFRDEIGKYILCECKDWRKKVNFSSVAKFCRVIESVKIECGIIFSNDGISGDPEGSRDASREILKIFHSKNLPILVITAAHIDEIVKGKNFIVLLRNMYESLKFDLHSRSE